MYHTKMNAAERPALSARFIATEWLRGVGYALLTLFTGWILYLCGVLAIMGADALLRGQAFESVDTLMQAVVPIAMVGVVVMGMASEVAIVLKRPHLAALFRVVFALLLVVSLVGVMITAFSDLHHGLYHCSLGGPQ